MSNKISVLKTELKEISAQISRLKGLLELQKDHNENVKLEKELKQLQYQALFYIENINNLGCDLSVMQI